MPAYAQNPANYLGTTIAAAQNVARAGVKQSTQYVVNPKEPEQCEAIVGAIGYEYKGEPTGLKTGTAEVYGIAVFMGGAWKRVTVAGAWTSFTYNAAKWEAFSGSGQTPQVRTEGGTARLRGQIIAKAAYTREETTIELPAGWRPPGTTQYPGMLAVGATLTPAILVIEATGKLWVGQNVETGNILYLDGVTYNIT